MSLTDDNSNEFNSEIGRLGLAASYKTDCLGILQKTVLWILIFTHPGSRIPDPGSRIPDPKTATKERGEKKLMSYIFI
jgi:hypothetical protein